MCYDSVLLKLFCPHSELSNGVFWVSVACVVFEKIEENRRSEIARSVIIVHKCINYKVDSILGILVWVLIEN